ncbi:MAG TPA: phenylalanine--tRNA ligase subunit beta [Pyrinomonadaceae bacterium]|nr:phenylalanine--tRNA ligase subunit beta [Pyrinomonadaceae bacterium]
MLISYNWLRELTGTTLSTEELRERLTMVGLAIDAVEEKDGDSVLDVEVPSNRPDCLSHIGIAREVAVIESGAVRHPEGKPANVNGRAADFTAVEILDSDLCPRYAARLVRGVKIGPSPEWLARRLEEIGQRPINNVADITNYVLHETGQPLHAFDFAKLAGRRIVVRRAAKNEQIKTLDGVERKLDETMLVIADAERPVALAGIMGGEDSEISPQTTEVLIESAYFNPDSVRQTARKLGMDTEASRRFERGADCENVIRAQARCVELICEVAGGVATEDVIDVYPIREPELSIKFHPARVEALTSLRVPEPEMERILKGLGFAATNATAAARQFRRPSWRVDVELEEDLVEEIARHWGYDKMGEELPPTILSGEYQHHELKLRALRRALKGMGFDEAINFSFIDAAHDDAFALIPAFANTEAGFVTLKNPIIDEAVRMRPTLLPGLLTALRHNLNHGVRDVRLWEIGRVFAKSMEGVLPGERESLALIATGGVVQTGRAQALNETDFFDLKGALEAGVSAMNVGPMRFAPGKVKHLRSGQAAMISLDEIGVIGWIGRLTESLASAFKFRQPVYVAELDLSQLLASTELAVHYQPLPRYPSVVRDVTLLLDRKVSVAELLSTIASENVAGCRGAAFVGTYEGNNIPAGKRTVTLRVEYRADDRTLRDEEVEERQRHLIDSLLQKYSAQLH